MISTAEQQYLHILNTCVTKGTYVFNNRTDTLCKTILNQRIEMKPNEFPLVTTRKSYWKQAIMEMICYMRGYTNLDDFHKLGVNTWDANCNAWFNPNKKSDKDCGIIYGASAEATGINFPNFIKRIMINPSDRGLIWNFWNPQYFHLGCLRPCMYSHQVNILADKVYLTSTQRLNRASLH